jgi:O-antigen/teichoic acid export membrane protein
MQQKFLSNFTLTVVLNLAVKLFWVFGIDVAVQNMLGSEVYGDYFALFNFAYIFAIISDAGIINYNNRVIAGEPNKLSFYLANILAIKTGLFVIYLLALVVFSVVVGYSSTQLGLLLIIGINQGLITFYNYLRSNVSALHLFRTESFLSVSDKLVMIILCGLLLWINPFGIDFNIYTFAWVQVVGLSSGVIISFIVLYRFIKKAEFKVHWGTMREILKKSYPYAVLITLMSFYTRLDAVMIERLLPDGANEAGIYASGFRLLDSLIMFAVLMANMLLPMFGRLIHRKQPVGKLIKQSFAIMMLPAVAVPLLAWFYRDDLYQLIYPNLYTEYGAVIFAWVLTAFVPISMGYIFGTLLTANGSLRQLNIISVLGLGANFVLNFILIPQYKAMGACIATIGTQSLVIVLTVLYCRKFFGFALPVKFLGSILVFVAVAIGIFYVLTFVQWDWKLESLVALALLAVLALVSGLIKINELLASFKPGADNP